MIKKNSYKLTINSDTILLFDMDGTLIDTDYTNYLSYKYAINSYFGSEIKIAYNPQKRFNRSTLLTLFPDLSESDINYIIDIKETNYGRFIHNTQIIPNTVDILLNYYKTNTTILVTNSREDRAINTLTYHNIYDKFSYVFFRKANDTEERINKYSNCLENLDLQLDKIIVFENEHEEIVDAIKAGVSENKIIHHKL